MSSADPTGLHASTGLSPESVLPPRVGEILAALSDQFAVTLGSVKAVSDLCQELKLHLNHPSLPADGFVFTRLASCLAAREGELAVPVFELLLMCAHECKEPEVLYEMLLQSRDEALMHQALDELLRAINGGACRVTRPIIDTLAIRADKTDSEILKAQTWPLFADILHHCASPDDRENTEENLILSDSNPAVRRLAARMLDAKGVELSDNLPRTLFSQDDAEFLRPYFAFTRISHVDLLSVAGAARRSSAMVESLRCAEAVCGAAILRDIVVELGWPRMTAGITVERRIGVSVAGSLPLMLPGEDAQLLESCGDVQRTVEAYIVVACGGLTDEPQVQSAGTERVDRYRTYNLRHAELLDLILRIEPLTTERLHDILERMDAVVEDFITLFSAHSDECSILQDVYDRLKQRILTELEHCVDQPQLSPELTRLVQMFEEPRSFGTVRTIHGLKRYLHQQGLTFGFRLLEVGSAPGQSVEVMVVAGGQCLRAKPIRFVNFGQAGDTREQRCLPYPVQIVADGFARQLLHGHTSFPSVDVYCYGNEVHYYLAYRAHPAFLRIDFSPPLRGGMIDLEYFGVSNAELDVHPNLSLDAIQTFFRGLDFDVQLAGTRLHVRCDKERVLDLGTLCGKAKMLFCLAPHMMDVDWSIGSLALDADAKTWVAKAWAESFVLWGVLPVKQLLTSDRTGILMERISNAMGEREVAWPGSGEYRDVCTATPPEGFYESLNRTIESLDLETLPLHDEDSRRPMGQCRLEQRLFQPLWSAVQRGEVVADEHGYHRTSTNLFKREHEAVAFAYMIYGGTEIIAQMITLARLLAPLERMMSFSTTGSVQELTVQRAALPLLKGGIGIFVLRDSSGIARMAFFARDEVLYSRRQDVTQPWHFNGSTNRNEFVGLLRENNYMVSFAEPSAEGVRAEAELLRDDLLHSPAPVRLRPLSGERSIEGTRASPGRAVGKAMFGTAGRTPEDVDGAILFCDTIRPDDNAFLFRCAGIVTTGGGVLSHAGLMAVQFGKPAMIIPARWKRDDNGRSRLLFMIEEFEETEQVLHGMNVITRHLVHPRECELVEGHLVVLNATQGTLLSLGGDRDVMAIHTDMRQLREATRCLRQATAQADVLELRGRSIRARYQLEKVLTRLSDPVVGRYAIHELMEAGTGGPRIDAGHGSDDFLRQMFRNPHIGADARNYVNYLASNLEMRCLSAARQFQRHIGTSQSPYEILLQRLEWHRLRTALESVNVLLKSCDVQRAEVTLPPASFMDDRVCTRLHVLREELIREREGLAAEAPDSPLLRHHLRQLERLDMLLDLTPAQREKTIAWMRELAVQDDAQRERVRARRVVASAECGIEHAPLIGYKAGNLAETARLAGADKVPPWFVITDTAFQDLLRTPMADLKAQAGVPFGLVTLGVALEIIVSKSDSTDGEKSRAIRQLWDSITLPALLADKVKTAYHQLARADEAPLVALRSSGREEDTEMAASAGEFETFLFVRGEEPLVQYLKRTWSGLWTERAIYNRAHAARGRETPGGGVIVQRMIPARISGVLLTANVATGNPREIVINVGLGLGEGIVSGIVAADHVVVSKDVDLKKEPLRFKYVTADKRQQVIFNERTGSGTALVDTLYHQRLRPALEYVELLELVAVATRLEKAYGYPLDLEFAIEGTTVWILQTRPVPAFISVYRETLDHLPLATSP